MRIGINMIALYDTKSSGAFRYIKLLMQQLGRYDLSDCEFVVYKQQLIPKEYIGIPETLKVEYVDVPNVGHGISRIIFEQTLFYRYLKPCDVFYSYCTSMPLFVRAKRIFTLHDVYYLTCKERYGTLQTAYLKFITKLYCRRSTAILTVSEFSKSEICRHLDVSPEKISITTNFLLPEPPAAGVDPETVRITDIDGREADMKKPFFLYVGNLQPAKNIDGMTAGFGQFSLAHPEYNLIIVGKPTNKGDEIISHLRRQAASNVYYIGYQSREVVEYLFGACVATVLLSFCEGFGIPPLEGFRYGKPALVSNAASLPEVVGPAGVLADPYNTEDIAAGFEQIIARRESLAAATAGQLKKFSPEHSVQVFMNVLGIKTND